MGISGRNPSNRHQTTGSIKAGGIDPSVYWDFQIGDRVKVREGFFGVVSEVLDGPCWGSEVYVVTLDGGAGGGEYGSNELTLETPAGAQRTASTIVQADQVVVESAVEAAGIHLASDDYPELSDILVERPPLERTYGSKTANWVVVDAEGHVVSGPHETSDDARDNQGPGESIQTVSDETEFDGWAKGNNIESGNDYLGISFGSLDETPVGLPVRTTAGDRPNGQSTVERIIEKVIGQPGMNPDGTLLSWDWCRFRRNQHCWYPRELDIVATAQAGYNVWVPFDRGLCPYAKYDDQKNCPVAMPGPRSREEQRYIDATVPWEEGGQRGGERVASVSDNSFAFHFTAGWKEVQAKAKKIRSAGGVRILAVTDTSITANVQGDTGNYQTTITRESGKYAVAMWECSCDWAQYAWARSGRWKKYEGRMCAHALALNYEVQAQEWQGGTVQENPEDPGWEITDAADRTKPGPWIVGEPRAASLRPVCVDPELAISPKVAMLGNPVDDSIYGRVRSRIVRMFAIRPDGTVRIEGDALVPGTIIINPNFHPTLGLDWQRRASLDDLPWSGEDEDEGEEEDTDIVSCNRCGRVWVGDLDILPNGMMCPSGDGQRFYRDALGQWSSDNDPIEPPGRIAANSWPYPDDDEDEIGDYTSVPAAEAMLHDEPEPALPTTDGASTFDTPETDLPDDDLDAMVQHAMLINGSLSGQPMPQMTAGLEWLSGGGSPQSQADTGDIASAAEHFLVTGEVPQGITAQAGKVFTHSEQMAIINEGEGVRTGNFDRLDITGTHYEAIIDGDDDDFLFG